LINGFDRCQWKLLVALHCFPDTLNILGES
jgi:hypothetical protein